MNWHSGPALIRARVRRLVDSVWGKPLWRWAFLAAAALVIGAVVVSGLWTVRHAWAIYKLNRGVGDTVFYDADDRPWFRLDEQRQDVPFDRIATSFKDAVIAVEDHRFYLHPGIDPIGLSRAVVNNLRSQERQGGSTITQQLARTLFLSNTRTYGRKAKEAVLSLMLEIFLSKREILQLYMNRVYLGGGIYGVETMSRRTFGKPAADLTLGEAALLAGVIRAPASYSPWNRLEHARARSFIVLRRMREEGKITAAQEQSARREKLRVRPAAASANNHHGYAKEFLRQQFRDLIGNDNPPDWKVKTTFVQEVQDAAEVAVRNGLRRLGVPGLQAALVAIDPHNGSLLALVGGSDYQITPFNRATRSHRQPGSAFKPFVYAAALEQGLSPVSTISGLQQVAVQAPEGVWIPRDDRAKTHDTMTLREALLESSNAAAVLLQQRVGARPVIKLADDLGVPDQPDVPSLALGSGLVTPLELTAAYAVFPGMGYRSQPRGLISIEDADGDEVEYVHLHRQQVLSEQVAYQMVTMLQDVTRRGTAASLQRQGLAMEVGGKTGTTNDSRDAWFVGFSSSVVVGVWIGFDDPQTIRSDASGSRMALPIWADFMRRTARRLPAESFPRPPRLRSEVMCSVSYHRALDGCPSYVEYFKPGDDIPTQLCELHSGSLKQRAERALRGLLGAIGEEIRGIFR
ncbi:MAG TPA: PBP1A family penicillin-binding protein [Vicinamibacterales bacterium]|jgi:1A family penicillin-binding protein|nr:PBP1A family penicillin-binding protein [Vicinamibacterales bacterium]